MAVEHLTRDEWEQQVFSAVARSIPDNHGEGFARAVVAGYLEDGGYEAYLAGEYDDGFLWQPERKSDR